MKKLLLLLAILPALAYSQNFHLSFGAGLANYQGDLKQNSLSLKQMRFVGSIGARYDLSEHLLLRTNLSLGSLRADDSKNKDQFLKERNLSFQTKLFEWELGAQYNFFNLNYKWWTPYVFAGAAVFHFDPMALNNADKLVKLQPLSTEGQGFTAGRKVYKRTQLSIPLGIGAEYLLTEDLRIGLEIGYRKTFTDYIDDVSKRYVDQSALFAAKGQLAVDMAYRGTGSYPVAGTVRGSEKNKDAYIFMQVKLIWRPFVDWYQRTSGLPSMKKQKKVGCPGTRVDGF